MGTHDGPPVTAGRTIHWARHYDGLLALLSLGRIRGLRARTVALARLAPGEAVLDVGCGTGDLTLRTATLVGPTGMVRGIDAAPEMVAVARRKATRAGAAIDFRVAAVEALPFPDATFDVALSSLMLHHLPDDLKHWGLAEIRRVLRTGGRLVIVDLRRPVTRAGRAALALLFHGGLKVGAQDYGALLAAAGFSMIDTGRLGRAPFGFARATAAPPVA